MSLQQTGAFNSFNLTKIDPKSKAQDNINLQRPQNNLTNDIKKENHNISDTFSKSDKSDNNDKNLQSKKWWYIGTAATVLISIGILGAKGFLGESIQKLFAGVKKAQSDNIKDISIPANASRIKTILNNGKEEVIAGLKKEGLKPVIQNNESMTLVNFKNKNGTDIILAYSKEEKGKLLYISTTGKDATRTDFEIADGKRISETSHYLKDFLINKIYNGNSGLDSMTIRPIDDLTSVLYYRKPTSAGFKSQILTDTNEVLQHICKGDKHYYSLYNPFSDTNTYISGERFCDALIDLYQKVHYRNIK